MKNYIKEAYRLSREYHTNSITQFGDSPQGTDYKSADKQEVSVMAAVNVLREFNDFSIGELGPGTGKLLELLYREKISFTSYKGFDVTDKMMELCKKKFAGTKNVSFHLISDTNEIQETFDLVVAGGIFNLKFEIPVNEWEKYVFKELKKMNEVAKKGFIFNMLTSYSDREYMKERLYYGSPTFYFDYCKRNFSRYVRLIHDYPFYEFTILVRKE